MRSGEYKMYVTGEDHLEELLLAHRVGFIGSSNSTTSYILIHLVDYLSRLWKSRRLLKVLPLCPRHCPPCIFSRGMVFCPTRFNLYFKRFLLDDYKGQAAQRRLQIRRTRVYTQICHDLCRCHKEIISIINIEI
jgi:hypothetical protein